MLETKVFQSSELEFKADGDTGIVTAYASIFGTADEGNDIVERGAFSRTLKDRAGKIIYLPSHDYKAHIKDIPAVPMSIEEDDKGLRTITKFFLNTQAGKDSFTVLKEYQNAGIPLGLSFTF